MPILAPINRRTVAPRRRAQAQATIPVDVVLHVANIANGAAVDPTKLVVTGTNPGITFSTDDLALDHVECIHETYELPMPFSVGGVAVPAINRGVRFNATTRPAPTNYDFIKINLPAGFHDYTGIAIVNIIPDNSGTKAAHGIDFLGGNNGDEMLLQWHRNDFATGPGDIVVHPAADGAGRRILLNDYKNVICWCARGTRMLFYVLRYSDLSFVGAASGPITLGELPGNQLTDYLANDGVDVRIGPQAYNYTDNPIVPVPFTLPAPTGLTLTQVGGSEMQLEFTVACDTFRIDEWNGTSWTTKEAFIRPPTIEDGSNVFRYAITGLSLGNVRKYRIRSLYGFADDFIESEWSAESNQATLTTFADQFDNFDTYVPTTALSAQTNWDARGGGTGLIAYVAGDAPGTDYEVEVTLTGTDPDNYGTIGPAVRIQDAANSGYALLCGQSYMGIATITAGAASYGTNYGGATAGDKVRLRVTGTGTATRLAVYKNGTALATNINPPSYFSGGRGGVGMNESAAGAHITDWSLYEL